MQNPRAARLVDFARHAGVSVSTASRALNRPDMVSPETRERVEAAVRALRYTPDRIARCLITGRLEAIALVIPDLVNAYFALISRAAQHLAREHGYEIGIFDTLGDQEREREIVHAARSWADGIILCAPLQQYRQSPDGPPIVYVNRRVEGAHCVLVDQRSTADAQLGYLLELGHERIAWAAGPEEFWVSEERRRRAECWAARCDLRIVSEQPPDFRSGARIAERLPDDVTAVACFNDRQALGLVNRAIELGRRVPEDLSVVGVGDTPSAVLVRPKLTTVRIPKEEIGRAAVRLLLEHLESQSVPVTRTLHGELVVRGSTAPPRGGCTAPRAASRGATGDDATAGAGSRVGETAR